MHTLFSHLVSMFILTRCSRVCVWFHERGEDEASTGTGQCWNAY